MSEEKFLLATPKKWKNKTTGKFFKVLPWFQPMDNESRFDFKGLIGDVFPELKEDVLSQFNAYSGLVMQVGWLIENENGVWLGLVPVYMKDEFEEVGNWTSDDVNEGVINE